MRPNQRQGQQAGETPSAAEINRRSEGTPRPQNRILDVDRHRVQHRHTRSLPQQYGSQQRGNYIGQNDPNTYQDGHRRHHSSVTGRIGSHALERISAPFLHNHPGISTPAQRFYPQYPAPVYPGPVYPGPVNPGPQFAVPQQVRGLESTYTRNVDESGILQAEDYFPPPQDVFGRFPPTFNDQMVAGPPEPQAGIPNSMAPFDSTSFQQGYIAPDFSPNPWYGSSSHGQRVSPNPFRSLLSSPYLLPALPGTPNQEQALTQGSYQFPSEVLLSSVPTHEPTRSHAARNREGNLYENQTTVDPRDLTIVQQNLGGPMAQSLNSEQNTSNMNRSSQSIGNNQSPVLYHPRTPRQSLSSSSRPADQTPNIGRRPRARYLPGSAVSDSQSEPTHLVSQQQLIQTPTRPRVPRHQGESHDTQGQGSEKRKRRENSSPEAESSPRTSAQKINPGKNVQDYGIAQQNDQTPPRAQTSKNENQKRRITRLKVLLPSQPGTPSTPPSNERHTGAMVEPETLNAAPEVVLEKQETPYRCDVCGKPYISRRGLQHHQQKYCKREDQEQNTPRRQTLNSPEAGSGLRLGQSENLPSLPSNEGGTGARVNPETLDAATETVGTGEQKPFPCDTCGKRYGNLKSLQSHYRQYCKRDITRRRWQTLNPPEARSGLVMTGHERPVEVVNSVLSGDAPHHNQSDNENSEQQLLDNAQDPSPLAQESGNPQTPPQRVSGKEQKAHQSPFFTELEAYNGVVTPSKLDPGEAPRVPSWSKGQQPLQVGAECPICGVLFGRRGHLQQHFVACARKNGNPDGRYWDELLEDR